MARRGANGSRAARPTNDGQIVIKEEKMPDGRLKLILKDEATGDFSDVVSEGETPVVNELSATIRA